MFLLSGGFLLGGAWGSGTVGVWRGFQVEGVLRGGWGCGFGFVVSRCRGGEAGGLLRGAVTVSEWAGCEPGDPSEVRGGRWVGALDTRGNVCCRVLWGLVLIYRWASSPVVGQCNGSKHLSGGI